MVIHDKKLSVPYAISSSEALEHAMAREIIRTMIRYRCAHTTIRKSSLVSQMKQLKKWFLTSRSMPQLVFAHENIAGLVPEKRMIHDGDGDVVFTG